MTRRAKMRMQKSSTYGKPFAIDPEEPGIGFPKAMMLTRDPPIPPKLGYSDAENLALEVGQLRETNARLETECARLSKELRYAEGQVIATKNHRLQTIAAPIMAELMGSMYRGDGIVTQELDSVARIAIQAAQCLLTELETLEKKKP